MLSPMILVSFESHSFQSNFKWFKYIEYTCTTMPTCCNNTCTHCTILSISNFHFIDWLEFYTWLMVNWSNNRIGHAHTFTTHLDVSVRLFYQLFSENFDMYWLHIWLKHLMHCHTSINLRTCFLLYVFRILHWRTLKKENQQCNFRSSYILTHIFLHKYVCKQGVRVYIILQRHS